MGFKCGLVGLVGYLQCLFRTKQIQTYAKSPYKSLIDREYFSKHFKMLQIFRERILHKRFAKPQQASKIKQQSKHISQTIKLNTKMPSKAVFAQLSAACIIQKGSPFTFVD